MKTTYLGNEIQAPRIRPPEILALLVGRLSTARKLRPGDVYDPRGIKYAGAGKDRLSSLEVLDAAGRHDLRAFEAHPRSRPRVDHVIETLVRRLEAAQHARVGGVHERSVR